MRRFYIEPDQVLASPPRITGPDVRHMKKVLRLVPGDRILLIDGTGYEYVAEIEDFSKHEAFIRIREKNLSKTESHLEIVIAQGFLKEKKMDNLVRHLTELGITRWVPMISERAVARPDPHRMAERIKRWESIAIEALKQCGRAKMPEITNMQTFGDILAGQEDYDSKLIFWENEIHPLEDSDFRKPKKILLLLGPEGGFTEKEASDAQHAGFTCLSLGPRILRSETAALSACTLVQYLFGDLKKVLDSRP